MLAKPEKRGPKPRRYIARSTERIPQRSRRPHAVSTRKADALWSKRVRERAAGLCEWCWDHDLLKGEPGTDSHHVRGRSYRNTRHALFNGVFLCRICHNWAHKHSREFKAWFASAFPQHWAAINAVKKEAA